MKNILRPYNGKNKTEVPKNIMITLASFIVLTVFAVLLFKSTIRETSIQLLSEPIMFILTESNAFAQQHEGMSNQNSNNDMAHDHSGMEMKSMGQSDIKYDVSNDFKKQLEEVFQGYFHIQFALSHDDVQNAGQGAKHLEIALSKVDMMLLSGDAHMAWMMQLKSIKMSGATIAGSSDINTSRTAFNNLSKSLISVAKMFGISGKAGLYRYHCSMAFDKKGADWLQNKSGVENPFLGSAMLTCGELFETINEIQ